MKEKTTKCKICGKTISETDYFWLGFEEKVNSKLESQIFLYKICEDHYKEAIIQWNMLYDYQERMQLQGKVITPIIS